MKNTVKIKFLAMLLCTALLLYMLPVSVWAATEIDSVAVTNVPTPFAGNKVPVSATVNTTGAQLYSLDWYDKTAGRFLESTDYFIENHVYEVQLWVEAKSGYEFRTNGTVPNVAATVGGKTATVSKAYEYQAWAMIVVSYTFEPCGKMEIKSVDIQLEGITKSGNVLRVEEGQYVPFSIQSGDEKVMLYPQLHTRYHPYGFHWSNSTKDTTAYNGDRFQGGCDYYVTIALKPRDSAFTFADNFTATIGGKSAQIKAFGKTYAEICVEVTCIGTIYAGNITPVVSLPRDGNAPDYSLTYDNCEHIEYATVTGWYDVETGARLLTSEHQFRAGKQYRVEVECTAAYAYKFQRDANDKMEYTPLITGHKVDSYSFGYDSYRGRELITLVKTFTAIAPEHTHTAGGWQCDESGHKKYCTVCGEDMGGSAHFGGEATCAQGKLCEVCGYEFTKPTENHTPDTSKWFAQADMYHYHPCKICGAHFDTEDHRWSPTYLYQDPTGHAWICADCNTNSAVEQHNPGPAATDTTPQTCKDCGYIIEPIKNHTHELTKVPQTPASCLEEGNIEYYTCSGCNDRFTDADANNKIPETMSLAVGALGHTASENWQTDETYHWRICSRCNQVLDETKIQHDLTEGNCATCSYGIDSGDPIVEAEPTETTPSSEGNKKSDNTWISIVLVGLVCFAAAITATVIILKKKRK